MLRLREYAFIKTLGFSLDEIKGLMALNQRGSCSQTHDAAVAKLALLESRINDLTRIKKTLKRLIKECEIGENDVSCPIIEALGNA